MHTSDDRSTQILNILGIIKLNIEKKRS